MKKRHIKHKKPPKKEEMPLNKKVVKIIPLKEEKEEKSKLSASKNLSLVWEVTKNAFAFRGYSDAQLRLQRHIIKLIKKPR